jgi:hypothetical protein
MMRALSLLALLLVARAAPAAGQGILLPAGCPRTCLPGDLSIDSVGVWANLERGQAGTFVRYTFRNDTRAPLEGAFFFPLPADATLVWTTVYTYGVVETHGEWSGPDETRRIMHDLAPQLAEPVGPGDVRYAMVHVPIPTIPAHGTKHLQIHYTQPLRAEGASITYRYPLAAGTAARIGHLELGMTISTEAGFDDLRSPSHAVNVQPGTELAPCPPQMRCGYRGVTSHRVKVVRLRDPMNARTRDFELVYTPTDPASGAATVP